jgi:hypothetical protein
LDLATLPEDSWLPVPQPYFLVNASMQNSSTVVNGQREGTSRASVVIDASVVEGSSWMIDFCSSTRVRNAKESGNEVARIVVSEASRHDVVVATVKKLPFPLGNIEFVNRLIAFTDGADTVVVAEPVEEIAMIDYGMKISAVRCSTRILCRFTPISDDQCTCSIIQRCVAKDNVLLAIFFSRVTKIAVPHSLAALASMRVEFQRDREVDELAWNNLELIILNERLHGVYLPEEDSLMDDVYHRIGKFKVSICFSSDSPAYTICRVTYPFFFFCRCLIFPKWSRTMPSSN